MPTVYCQCGEAFQVVEQHYGRRIQCGRCGRRFEVVRPAEPEARPFQYTSSPPRDPYRQGSPPPRDPYRSGQYEAPRGGDPYRNDPYRNAPPPRYDQYGAPDMGYDDEAPRNFGAQMKQVSGFFTPQIRLYLFIAFAGLLLMAATIMLSVMKPVGPTPPPGVSGGAAEEG